MDNVTAPAARTSTAADTPARWGGVLAMTVCVFALIASEFMPVSLLTPIAGDLGISEGQAGQGIAISGALAVVTSLTIGTIARGVDRKVLLLALTAIMAVSGAVVALAPTLAVYLLGRALIGIVIGGFWSMSAATTMRLVPPRDVPRALALLNGGNALATVLAAPLGAYLGTVIGWRGAFIALVPIAVIAFVWQLIGLPSLPAPARTTRLGSVFVPLGRRSVRVGLFACGLFFLGQFMLYSYVRPFLETVTRADAATVSLVLLVVGVAGLLGTALIGRVLGRGLYRVLIVVPVLLAGVAVVLIPAGAVLWAVVVLFAVWGILATSAPVGWWSWIARVMPDDAEAGGGLMVAIIQLCIAVGSSVGGILFDSAGHGATFGTSAGILLLAAFVAVRAARVDTVGRG